MFTVRKAADRFHSDHGWLNSFHTFSFAEHYDPRFEGFRNLRVINDDTVAAGRGFGTHGHRDMEIVSIVLEGALGHQDSMGNGSVIRPGDVQLMSAGTGVRHSEMNASKSDAVHFLQIWVIPNATGLSPSYQQQHFGAEQLTNRFVLVADPEGRDGAVTLHADARIHRARVEPGAVVEHTLQPLAAGARNAWLHVASGDVTVNGAKLGAGDGVSFVDEETLRIEGGTSISELVLFELA